MAKKTSASDCLVRCLENEGVEYIFGVPGEENLDFLESLSHSKKIRLILTRHEQTAGFMAATYGRLTGRAGVCLATLGPGATNLVTAAAYAQLGAMPMFMITGQKPIKSSKQGRFQILIYGLPCHSLQFRGHLCIWLHFAGMRGASCILFRVGGLCPAL